LLLGLVLIPLNAFWLVRMEVAGMYGGAGGTTGPYPTSFSLYANAVVWLLLLIGVNRFLGRRMLRLRLSQAELLVVYVMLVVASSLHSLDLMDVLVPMLGHPTWFATPENGWARTILPHIPAGWRVQSQEALIGYYQGNSSLYRWEVLRAWLPPVLTWGAFLLVLVGTMLCLSSLVRRRWVEEERLAYPIVQLPLNMTEPGGRLLADRLLWLGAGLSGGIALLNGFATWYPSIPEISVRMRDMSPYFTTAPWNAIGWTPISFYPFAIGMSYLLPVDLLFSCWFFYLFWKVERISGAALGLAEPGSRYPYINEQCLGAYLAIIAAALSRFWILDFGFWIGPAKSKASGRLPRPPLPAIQNPKSKIQNPEEALPPRLAIAGAILGTATLAYFFAAVGLSPGLALGGIGLYLAISLAVTRMRAELGPPAHDLHFIGPEQVFATVYGTRALGAPQLVLLSYFFWFNRAYRGHPMPNQLEAFKMGERTGISPRAFVLPIVVASVAGVICGFWTYLHFAYQLGGSARMPGHVVGFGREPFDRLSSWLATPGPPDHTALGAIAVGAGVALMLQVLKLRFAAWPLHPLGFAVSGSWSMNTIWVPVMIAWAAKALTLRYAGLRGYRTLLPFFFGLILGDFTVGCLWPLIGWALQVPYYSFQQ
jgi:uncharacterized protein DUF6785/uncharacterized protein DUF6784